MNEIPASAAPDVQQAFRSVWQALQKLSGGFNIDLSGRRVLNAGPAVSGGDYVTKAELDALAARVTQLGG